MWASQHRTPAHSLPGSMLPVFRRSVFYSRKWVLDLSGCFHLSLPREFFSSPKRRTWFLAVGKADTTRSCTVRGGPAGMGFGVPALLSTHLFISGGFSEHWSAEGKRDCKVPTQGQKRGSLKTNPRSPSPTSLGPGRPDRYQRAFPKPNRLTPHPGVSALGGRRPGVCTGGPGPPRPARGQLGEGWAVEVGEGRWFGAGGGTGSPRPTGRALSRERSSRRRQGIQFSGRLSQATILEGLQPRRLRPEAWVLRALPSVVVESPLLFREVRFPWNWSVAWTKSILATLHFHLENRSLCDSPPLGSPGAQQGEPGECEGETGRARQNPRGLYPSTLHILGPQSNWHLGRESYSLELVIKGWSGTQSSSDSDHPLANLTVTGETVKGTRSQGGDPSQWDSGVFIRKEGLCWREGRLAVIKKKKKITLPFASFTSLLC